MNPSPCHSLLYTPPFPTPFSQTPLCRPPPGGHTIIMDATTSTDPNGVLDLAAATRTRSCTIPSFSVPNGVFYLAAATRTRSCTIPSLYDPNGVFYPAAATHATLQTGVFYLAAAQHHLRAPGDRVLALASYVDTNSVGDLPRPEPASSHLFVLGGMLHRTSSCCPAVFPCLAHTTSSCLGDYSIPLIRACRLRVCPCEFESSSCGKGACWVLPTRKVILY
jgi:hypothetical protein